VLFSSLSVLADPGSADYVAYALTLTFMVGVIELAMGIARLGGLVNFISHSVVVGFTAGAAVLIAASQLKNFFGFDMPRGLHLPEKLLYFVEHIGDIHPYATTAGTMAAYSPYSGGIPAIVANATPWGSTTMAPVMAARPSARSVLPLTSGHHARKGANLIQKSRFKL
jgi:hypothetical protein